MFSVVKVYDSFQLEFIQRRYNFRNRPAGRLYENASVLMI